MDNKEKYTDFGFKTVTESEKTTLVHKVFSSVASKYDIMNDLMSFFSHRLWKEVFVKNLSPFPGMKVLDVAGGTGDIAIKIIEKSRKHKLNPMPKVTVYDLTQSMLDIGKAKAADRGIIEEIDWICGDAANMQNIKDSSYDAYTISFGLRNVTQKQNALNEAFRSLKPGGRFLCMEFSKIKNPLLRKAYKAYAFNIIPKMGELVLNDKDSYEYLVESIEQFPDQETLKVMLESAGFKHVKYHNLFGGIVAIHSATKPWR